MRFLKHFTRGIKIDQVIQFLTYSDIMMLSGWGLVNPILAVFIADQVKGGSVQLAGLAITVYLIVKSVVQVPVARWIDLKSGERDDFWVMIGGSMIISLSAFLYAWVRLPWQVIAIQILSGMGHALTYPSWLAIFTRHVDRRQEGLEWSLYYTATDLAAALTAGLGGFLAATVGYQFLFLIVGFSSMAGTAFLAGMAHKLKRRT